MSIVRPAGLTLCTLALSLAVVPVPAGAAFAAGGEREQGEVRVSPSGPRPGEEVVLRVTGCRGASGTAHSEAFVAEAVLAPSAEGGLFGEARISSTVEPGAYPVDVSCDGDDRAVSGQVKVVADGGGRGHDKEPGAEHGTEHEREYEQGREHEREAAPSLPARPSAPVRAGGGGTAGAEPVAGEREERVPGVPTALTVLSGVLAAAAGLTVRRLRSRER
ncbi:hypothetical protein GCM10009757_48750 [Streptomyces cheonanensis]|uniref:Uncharacterized protein n=1 Tax=Streptomyces cheonanensis TaxID=312720 RepID=A0ABN2VNU8_9ACTN